ncbi:hypothetical protein [Desulfatitalea alkaliphila]|uniref:Uncharacterized protein n=1 Tax=Desulfatitalea alkaliphila TaxID=2929485 RepID=A0AA41R8R5_9BACT|nr:hypothetical protein [Desulfatitalea alkaliphila]MCJ8503155.1 hypothetical protein [Desulfatitalea alkaliphila]
MNLKQFLKLTAVSIFTYGICFFLIKGLNSCIVPVIEETLGAFVVVALFSSALSFALFAFTDGITKDIASLKDKFDSSKFEAAVEALAKLKKEVLSNAFLILLLFLVERTAKGGMIASSGGNTDESQMMILILLSLRMTCFLISFIAIISQLRGFLTAVDFRSLVSRAKR